MAATALALEHGEVDESYRRWCARCKETYHYNAWSDHLRSKKHTGSAAREFRCALCACAYNRKDALTAHMSAKHDPANLHKCATCEFATEDAAKLELHVQVHRLLEIGPALGVAKAHVDRQAAEIAALKEEVQRLREENERLRADLAARESGAPLAPVKRTRRSAATL